jgi:hypothetical protein
MKIISHRGNLFGSNPKTENTSKQISLAIETGFDVEIDLWVVNGNPYLGHDNPEHPTTIEFLNQNSPYLWIHCKNIEALTWIKNKNTNFNYFWHEKDKVTLTSLGIPWCYPETYVTAGITVVWDFDWEKIIKENPQILGICTDYPIK